LFDSRSFLQYFAAVPLVIRVVGKRGITAEFNLAQERQMSAVMESGSTSAKIAVYGFVFVFCAIGVACIYGAIVTLQDGDTTNAILILIAALAFGGFGLGVLALTSAGFRSQVREAALRAAHPDEPWKWRDDWATGQVRSMGKSATWFFWGLAILWNLIAAPTLIFLPEEIIENENYAALLGLLFPLVGIGLIVVAVRKTIQRVKYGDCLFQMVRVPGTLGGEVTGTILFPRGLPNAESLNVRLSCVHSELQRTNKGSSTYEEVRWQTEQSVIQLSPTGGGATQSAVVRFQVPYDVSPTGRIDERNSVLWKLEANAAVPGVDFATSFEIPVFKSTASSPQLTEEQLRSEDVSKGTPIIAPADHPGVAIVPSTGGGTEFILRTRGGIRGTFPAMAIVLIFAGIAALIAYAGAPFIFPLVFGMFALFLVSIVAFLAFGESRIIVEAGRVSVRNSLFGIPFLASRRVPCTSITKIGVKGESQGGKRGYYSITLTQEKGKTISPFLFLYERRQADWLAEEVRKAMEPWRGSKRTGGIAADRSARRVL